MTTKSKILFIVPIFPVDQNDDTIVPFIFQFTRFFSRYYEQEVDIDILTLKYPTQQANYTIDAINIYSIQGGFSGKWTSFITINKAVIKAIQLHKKNTYQGILSFWYGEAYLIGKTLSLFYKINHFTWFQGQDVKRNNRYLKLFKPNPNRIITVGENHHLLLKNYWNLNAKYIANVAVDPAYFPTLQTQNREIDILGVGNLGTLKNYRLFIEVVATLHKTIPNIKAVICGDGEQKEELQKLITSLQLEQHIFLKGYVSNAEVRNYMNHSKIVLHTSLFEGNSMVVQEALFSGCKVISTIPLNQEIQNFYFENKKSSITSRLATLLNEKKPFIQRIQPFKIEETAQTIYSCFFESKD